MFRQVIAKFHGELALYIGSVPRFHHSICKVSPQHTHCDFTLYHHQILQQSDPTSEKEQHSFWIIIYLFICYCSKHEMFQKSFLHLEFQSSSLPIIYVMKFDISFLVTKISIYDFIKISQNREKTCLKS
jgi:hypothetical protein